jgi:hypothetical protein
VPYPYAVDEYNNIYLLIEHIVILSNINLLMKMSINNDEPYCYYYDKIEDQDLSDLPLLKLNPIIIHKACF